MASPAAPPILPPESIDADRYGNTAFIIIEAVLVTIAAALVFARVYVRRFILNSVGFDELFIVIGLVSDALVGWSCLNLSLIDRN